MPGQIFGYQRKPPISGDDPTNLDASVPPDRRDEHPCTSVRRHGLAFRRLPEIAIASRQCCSDRIPRRLNPANPLQKGCNRYVDGSGLSVETWKIERNTAET
jgi:hypothetical protein